MVSARLGRAYVKFRVYRTPNQYMMRVPIGRHLPAHSEDHLGVTTREGSVWLK